MTAATETPGPRVLAHWGLWAIVAGATAMIMVFAQIQLATTTESPSVGQQIGEIAGERRRSAWRSFLGLSTPAPEPVAIPPSRQLYDMLQTAVPFAAGLAIILSAVSLLRRENWRLCVYGVALGGGALLFQYLWIMALLIVGCVLLYAIIENIGSIFGG